MPKLPICFCSYGESFRPCFLMKTSDEISPISEMITHMHKSIVLFSTQSVELTFTFSGKDSGRMLQCNTNVI